MSERTAVTVSDNTTESRYDASTDAGVVAGFAEYQDRDGVRIFTHTEVDDAFSGQGVGSSLARGALDDVRERGLKLRAKCEFIAGYLEKHPEYADLQA
ncbi:GNAT family N-acetyltransferase [Nocardioides pakistanensis]